MKWRACHLYRIVSGLVLTFVFWSCQKSNDHPAPAAGIALSFDDRYVAEWTQLRPFAQKVQRTCYFLCNSI
ncbi:MAG: hypothetical protein R2822_20950 [Spirosomataceae bacterium]